MRATEYHVWCRAQVRIVVLETRVCRQVKHTRSTTYATVVFPRSIKYINAVHQLEVIENVFNVNNRVHCDDGRFRQGTLRVQLWFVRRRRWWWVLALYTLLSRP